MAESEEHEKLKDKAVEYFKKKDYDVERESSHKEIRFKHTNLYPDLLLDGEIPVEIGDTNEEKLVRYLMYVDKCYWIPYSEGGEMELTKYEMEEEKSEVIECLREENEEIRKRLEKCKDEKEELREKLRETNTKLFYEKLESRQIVRQASDKIE